MESKCILAFNHHGCENPKCRVFCVYYARAGLRKQLTGVVATLLVSYCGSLLPLGLAAIRNVSHVTVYPS